MNVPVHPSASETLKGKRGDFPRKMGRVKRHIPKYSEVIRESTSGLPLKGLKGNVSSQPMLPLSSTAGGSVSRSPIEDAGNVLPLLSGHSSPRPLLVLPPMNPSRNPDVLLAAKNVGGTDVAKCAGSTSSKEGGEGMPALQPDFVSQLLSPEEYAKLFCSHCPPSGSSLAHGDLIFAQSYVEWASLKARSKVRGILMIDQYDRKCRRFAFVDKLSERYIAEEIPIPAEKLDENKHALSLQSAA
ncbi:hypothetical protein Bca52824_009109 [Brassica carinata]|uniref:Uncharacterized protein n=1 Tax=Brassica carinata TaxID=52824 RepID=A0A8X7WB56_BRACI|nr:hypothetical protein Bca52824_009109 [Brassica carinata]